MFSEVASLASGKQILPAFSSCHCSVRKTCRDITLSDDEFSETASTCSTQCDSCYTYVFACTTACTEVSIPCMQSLILRKCSISKALC